MHSRNPTPPQAGRASFSRNWRPSHRARWHLPKCYVPQVSAPLKRRVSIACVWAWNLRNSPLGLQQEERLTGCDQASLSATSAA
jgi:hypothetical protein